MSFGHISGFFFFVFCFENLHLCTAKPFTVKSVAQVELLFLPLILGTVQVILVKLGKVHFTTC